MMPKINWMPIVKLDIVESVLSIVEEKADTNNETHYTLNITLVDKFHNTNIGEIIDVIKDIVSSTNASLEHNCITYPVDTNNLKIFNIDLFVKWR